MDRGGRQNPSTTKALMPAKNLVSRTTKLMADGFNEARAMRVAEVMNDFQLLQRQITQNHPSPAADEYYEEGYAILRQCRADAQAVLSAPYDYDLLQVPSGPGEQEKRQLQRVLLDASARRFRSQRICLRALAAVRWANARNSILQGQKQHAGHTAALQQADLALRNEIANITDEGIVNEFRAKDWQAGHWLQEDPPLQTLLNWIRTHP